MIPTHFPLGPKARAKEKRCRGHATEDITEDDSVLGIPKPRRKEWHAIKGSPQSASRRKGKYSIGAIQGKTNTSALNVLTNVLAALTGKGPLNSVATKDKGNAAITAIKYSTPYFSAFTTTTNHFGYGLIRQVSALES